MKKQFLKIAGVSSETAFYKKYPTEAAFFAAHPEARKMAMGGMPEAYPQIATFKNAFSYGVPPGPQYLAHGGSAYPQAQTEQQFFIPIYTDVYNPYNKAMGGSNIEMYPNAKTTPHWGPTNTWFQDGGQEGMPQEEQSQELDRLGVQNRTGAFANMLKATAAKSNARTAMNRVGMAKYGKQLSKYDPGGQTKYTTSGDMEPYVTEQMSPTSSQFVSDDKLPLTYSQQLKQNYDALLRSKGMRPGQGGMWVDPDAPRSFYSQPRGYMNDFLPSIYDWNNQNQFMYQVKGSPKYKWKTNVPGEGKMRGVSNMDFLNAIFPELYGDTEAQMKALNDPKYADRRQQWGISEITNTPKGLFGKRRQTTIKFGDFTGAGTAADAGPSKTPMDLTRKNQPGPLATESSDPIPFTLEDANTQLQQNNPRAKAIMDNLRNALAPKRGQASTSASPSTSSTATQTAGASSAGQASGSPSQPAAASSSSVNPDADYITNSKYPDLDQPLAGTNMTQRERLLQQLNSSDPKEVEYAKYRIGVMNDWDAMQGSTTTTTSQPPSNANSMDAETAKKKASMISQNVNQDYIDAKRAEASGQAPTQEYLTGAPYRTQTGPLAEPSAIDFSEPVNPYASVMAGNAPITMTAQPDPNAYLTGAPERVPVGPIVGPEGFAYGGYTGYKFGGSYNKGDVVYMTDDEIAEFVRNGGQIEEME